MFLISMEATYTNIQEEKLPISTIRKAIQWSAEQLASKEFLDKAEQRHIDSALQTYKALKTVSPVFLKKIILTVADWKDLKDAIGAENSKVVDKIFHELIVDIKKELNDDIKSITVTPMSSKAYEKATMIAAKRYLDKKAAEFKQDPRVIAIFQGKEQLLDTLTKYISSLIDLANAS